MWEITENDLEPIAIGAGILGTGGGGNPYLGFLRARQAIRRVGRVMVIDPEEATFWYRGEKATSFRRGVLGYRLLYTIATTGGSLDRETLFTTVVYFRA